MNELNQNIYICVQDKKAGTVQHFSSDISKFGNLHIAQATKDVTIQKIEQFNSQVAKMQDNQLSVNDSSSQDQMSSNSKKDTEASSQGHKSEYSKITLFECSDTDQKNFKLDITSAAPKFEIFDQQKHLKMEKPSFQSLLNADLMSNADLPNEMSYQEMMPSCLNLLDINQVSNNSLHDDAINSQIDELEFGGSLYTQGLGCTKKYIEDEVGLRISSSERRFFTNNALFRSSSVL